METEAEIAREVLSELNKAPYTITPPRLERHISGKPKWFVSCLDAAFHAKTRHAKSVWADTHGEVWIDSADLGNTTDWVEDFYGEKGAVRSMEIDYRNLSMADIQSRLESFTKVLDLIGAWVGISKQVQQNSGVEVELLSDGGNGVAWFFLRARVNRNSEKSLGNSIGRTSKALKKAYDIMLERKNRQLGLDN